MAYLEQTRASAVREFAPAQAHDDDAWTTYLRSPRAKTFRLSQHEVIFYEGDPAERIYELAEGAVMLYKLLPDGRRQVVEILGPGDLFGFPVADMHDCAAETLVPTLVRALRRQDIETASGLQQHVTHCLLSQMETLHNHAVLLGRKSAMERVASFLMQFVPSRGGPGCTGPVDEDNDESVVLLTMTRQEIADYLGLTIETVSRVISEMKRRSLIRIEKQDRIRIMKVCDICHLTGAH